MEKQSDKQTNRQIEEERNRETFNCHFDFREISWEVLYDFIEAKLRPI
jgi:hypothetical protein